MPKGPRVYEIFSSKNLGQYEEQESVQQTAKLGKKSTFAPQPPGMKKFGGYKPKILGNENTDGLVETNGGLAAVMNTSNLNKKSRPAPPVPIEPSVILTKPKPFIVGDKDTPMVLSTVGDNENSDNLLRGDENQNEMKDFEQNIDDLHIYSTMIENEDIAKDSANNNILQNAPSLDALAYSEKSTLISSRTDIEPQGHINFALDDDESTSNEKIYAKPNVSFRHDNITPSNQSPLINHKDITTPNNEPPPSAQKIFFSMEPKPETEIRENDQSDSKKEPEGVYIPDPDYEEEEKTMSFAEEDPDSLVIPGEEVRLDRRRNTHPVLKMYDGEDLSGLANFSDDEFEQPEEIAPIVSRKQNKPENSVRGSKKLDTPRPTVNQKHTLFKQKPATVSKRNKKAKPQQQFNSVRSFSFADSKYGTQGKAAGKKMSLSELSGDEKFYNESDYESFLRSRHGDAMPLPPESNDSGVDMSDESPNRKDGPIWKKLTLRLKNKRQSKDFS